MFEKIREGFRALFKKISDAFRRMISILLGQR